MRVLLVTPFYPPAHAYGGPVKVAAAVVADLLAADHRVTVATTDALDPSSRVPADAPAEPPGAEVHRFPNLVHAVGARFMGWNPRGYRRWVRSAVPEHDVVLVYDFYSVLCVAAARAAAQAGVPLAVQPLGSLAPSRERGKPLVKRAFLAAWGHRTLTEASALVHSTEREREDFLAAGAPAERLVRLPLPLELPPDSDVTESSEPLLVSVGRLDPIKGIDRLLEAVALVRSSTPVELAPVGPGNGYGRKLERLADRLGIADAVRFRGFVEEGEKRDLLRRAQAFCLLSRSEGLPVAALEAMACGTPVVLSEGCNLPEVHRRAGFVVSGEPRETADAIAALLSDGELRREFGIGGRTFAAEFRREEATRETIALLERLVSERQPRAGRRTP